MDSTDREETKYIECIFCNKKHVIEERFINKDKLATLVLEKNFHLKRICESFRILNYTSTILHKNIYFSSFLA